MILALGSVAAGQVPVALGLFLLGLVGFATVPGLQARVMRHAAGATTLASATNIAAFNLGNTLGVSLAGASIAAGHGLRSPTLVGAGLALVGLVLVLAGRARSRQPDTSTARQLTSTS